MTIAKDDIQLIEKWIEENGDQSQEIYDFVNAHEIEVANIIDGKQVSDASGKTVINSYEIFFLCNSILIVRSEELQDTDNQDLSRKIQFLGELTIEN